MKRYSKPRASATAMGLLASALFAISMISVGNQVFAAPALDLLQVGLQPTLSLPFQYTLTAYNSSGYQAASYQSRYPAAAFQLPAGTYLVTASAYHQNSTYCYECPLGASTGAKQSAGTEASYRPYLMPYTEYGYAMAQVSGPTSLTIKMQNSSAMPLTSLSIHVGYANGTAAVGAYVSGYVVGSYYAYSPETVSYGQTGKTGTVTLVMPQAPVDVDAYLSMPIKLPKNSSVVTVEVGGQKVNVTVSLQPTYLSLYGQSLILPPQTGANVVLRHQPSGYPPVYYAGATGVGGAGGSTASPTSSQIPGQSGASANQVQSITQIAPFSPTDGQVSGASPPSDSGSGTASVASGTFFMVAAGVGVLAAVIAVAALLVRKSGSRAPPA